MHKATLARPLALALALGLTGCGSDPEPPTEQIVVREPGAPVVAPTGAVVAAAGATADVGAAGKAAFAACTACHSVDPGGASGIGPNLAGVVGRKAGALAGFTYSDAMKGSGITWSEGELDAFIADPVGKVPGTMMVAGGISDEAKRAAIVAYLASVPG
jgi:cytochrome c